MARVRIRSDYEKKKESKRQKARREARKENKQCIVCGKQDECTLAGKVRCGVCREKQSARYKRYTATEYGKEMGRIRHRETNDKLRAQGLCIRCCKNAANPGRSYCPECTEKYKEYNRKYLERKKKEKETCST